MRWSPGIGAGEALGPLGQTEQDVFAYESLRHVAAMAVVCAPAAVGGGLFDDVLVNHAPALRLLCGAVLALAAAIAGGWPVEVIGRDRRLVQVRLYLFVAVVLLLALHATLALEAHRGLGAGPKLLVMMAAAVLFSPCLAIAVPLALVAAYGASQTLRLPSLAFWLLPACLGATAILTTSIRGRLMLNLRLRDQRERLEMLLADYEHGSSDLVWEAAPDGTLRVARSAGGATRAVLPQAMNWVEFVRAGCRAETQARPDFVVVRDAIRREQPFRDCVLPVPEGGGEHWWEFSGRPVLDRQGKIRFYRGIASDVTERRAAERRVRHLAAHDRLTGLLNRSSFLAALADALAADAELELVLVNIDGFGTVNDTHGVEIGDALLTAVAERLAASVSALGGDDARLARLGGDEFGVLLPHGVAGKTGALASALGEPFAVAGLELQVGVSVGSASAPEHGGDGAALFKAASLALARAKAFGGAHALHYDPSLAAAQSERRALQLDLRSAVAREEFTLEYQPIVELATGRIIACEALARWNHPRHGRVSPALFIEIAEQIGLIAALGAWVVRTASLEAATWPEDVRVTVNVSPLQFRSPLLVQSVTASLASSGLAPARLVLEVTESTLLGADADTVATLAELRAVGVRLALDDFGTGYASLAYLDRFPFDALKVDRSFLHNSHRPATGAILQAVAKLGADLGMRTVAEGVETEAQRDRLLELGYDCAQGFLFARPMPADAIASLLARGNRPPPPTSPDTRTLGAHPAAV